MNRHDRARKILGEDFISPKEIAEAHRLIHNNEALIHFAENISSEEPEEILQWFHRNNGFTLIEKIAEAHNKLAYSYSDKVLAHLAETLPSEKILQWLYENSFVLIAGTPSPKSLVEVCALNPQLFFKNMKRWYRMKTTVCEKEWYEKREENFSRNDKVLAEWLMLRKSIVPNSTKKIWSVQQELLSKLEYVPNISEATWAITMYKNVRGIWLFPNILGLTSSMRSNFHCHVCIGSSTNDDVISIPDRTNTDNMVGCSDLIGLMSARKT